MLIDGGEGQLTAARQVFAELGVTDVPLVAISKGPDRDAGRETFHMPGRASFKLPARDPVLYFVQRLRDEAHRFAIGSHRQKRRKDIREAGLQEISGIGPSRKRALLRHFGTLKAIERASLADLAQVPGINAETARRVYDFFHERAAVNAALWPNRVCPAPTRGCCGRLTLLVSRSWMSSPHGRCRRARLRCRTS